MEKGPSIRAALGVQSDNLQVGWARVARFANPNPTFAPMSVLSELTLSRTGFGFELNLSNRSLFALGTGGLDR